MGTIIVLGSFMMDLVIKSEYIPDDGETLIGKKFERNPGGKGANQAATIARLGKPVKFIGMVGDDEFGSEARKVLKKEGVDVEHLLKTEEASTGIGSVWIDGQGNNRIIVIPGANHILAGEHIEKLKKEISNASLLILQLELNLKLTAEVVAYAKKLGVKILLNPAPATDLPLELLDGIDYLTPNESELASLTDMPVGTISEVIKAATVLITKGVKNVIVTLGEKGALWLDNSLVPIQVNGHKVTVSDTVAAGDSFNGALAYGIIEGLNKKEILHFANKVGALTVTKTGAIKSLPNMEEVNNFI